MCLRGDRPFGKEKTHGAKDSKRTRWRERKGCYQLLFSNGLAFEATYGTDQRGEEGVNDAILQLKQKKGELEEEENEG